VPQLPVGDHAAVAVQPSGTVTFVFTDVEGSTALLEGLGAGAYREALAEHRSVLREAFAAHSGYEVDEAGDGLFYAFASASEAVNAVREATASLADGPIRVRVGIHTGEALLDPPKYVGVDVHKAARIVSAAHGGQVVLSAATRELVTGDVLDLGRHRLKDVAEPISLSQLGSRRFPPLRTISNTNLPVPLSTFVGREREVREVVSLIRDERARLVTLAGPGGTGKTRLALEAAGELVSEFGDGVFWIGLAAVRDVALVVEAITQTVEAAQELSAHIGEKHLLLLLDNLEQVVDSAVELAGLLRECPNLCVLVTSRELLRIEGETVYPVPALAKSEAVGLFCARARIEPDDIVAELCERLDDLPLALELAAARVSVLTPAQILERVSQRLDLFRAGRGADPRQETLRATMKWSYELLSDAEKLLFAKLAVFRGGCTLEAAEHVVEADLDTLQSLVDKSLLRHSDQRFWMLQTIREYTRELLDGGGESDAVRRRHADHYAELAEVAYTKRYDPERMDWARQLDEELDNLRAALDFLDEFDAVGYLRLAGALGWFWDVRSSYAEASSRLEDALASTAKDDRLTARALSSLGPIDVVAGRFAMAVSRLEQAIELWRTLGDETEVLENRTQLGWACYQAGETSRALEVYEANLELARALGRQEYVIRSLAGICQVLLATGQFERAEPLALELGNNHYLADCAMDRRDYAAAERYRLRELEDALANGYMQQQITEILGLAMSAAGLGRDEEAIRLEGAVEARWEELGIVARPRVVETWRERDLGAARARLGEPRATEAFGEGRAMHWDQAVELALGKTPGDESSPFG
jgi:predicted ATPase/class 3 adenylate cyclase